MEAAAAEASKDRKKPETKEPFQESESLLAVQTPIVSWTKFFHLHYGQNFCKRVRGDIFIYEMPC